MTDEDMWNKVANWIRQCAIEDGERALQDPSSKGQDYQGWGGVVTDEEVNRALDTAASQILAAHVVKAPLEDTVEMLKANYSEEEIAKVAKAIDERRPVTRPKN